MCNSRYECALDEASLAVSTDEGVARPVVGVVRLIATGTARSTTRGLNKNGGGEKSSPKNYTRGVGEANGSDRDVMSLLEYVNELCTDICDVITTGVSKLYNAAPSSGGHRGHANNSLYEPLRNHGK